MPRDEKISLFLRHYNEEQRELFDNISGFILESFNSIKEIIKEDIVKYSTPHLGSLFYLKIEDNYVNIYFPKKKNQETLSFKSFNLEQKNFLINIFNTIKNNNN